MPMKRPYMLIFACVVLAGTGLFTHPAFSQQSASCDPEFMTTLKKRAWMEAQREIEANAHFELKPDSVMQMTCFDRHLDQAAGSIGPAFVEANDPNTSTTLDDALTGSSHAAMTSYLEQNGFHQGTLGGYGPEYSPTSRVSSGGYSCDQQGAMWEYVRTQDFDEGLFMTFEELKSPDNDLRGPHGRSNDYSGEHDEAKFDEALERLNTMQMASENEGYFDPMQLHREGYAPKSEVGCSPGIPTGVTVITSDNEFPEVVCPNPGCVPDGSGGCH